MIYSRSTKEILIEMKIPIVEIIEIFFPYKNFAQKYIKYPCIIKIFPQDTNAVTDHGLFTIPSFNSFIIIKKQLIKT